MIALCTVWTVGNDGSVTAGQTHLAPRKTPSQLLSQPRCLRFTRRAGGRGSFGRSSPRTVMYQCIVQHAVLWCNVCTCSWRQAADTYLIHNFTFQAYMYIRCGDECVTLCTLVCGFCASFFTILIWCYAVSVTSRISSCFSR